ncbi:hypothetical protein ACQPXT_40250 [Streptomyces sp. CA-100214]
MDPLGSSPDGCSAGRGPPGIGLPARFRGSSTGLSGHASAAQGGVRIFPEKSSADGAESIVGPETPFAEFLQQLYRAAGGGTNALRQRELVAHAKDCGHKLTDSSVSEWRKGQSVPHKKNGHYYYVRDKLIPWLEELAEERTPGYCRRPPAAWQALLDAAHARRNSRQGGRGPRVDAASRGILLRGASQTLADVFPLDFVGREKELAELEAFAAAPDGAPQYLWLQAGPWAGKTALLAWFAAQRLPTGVDAAHYFIVGRLGTNVREGFVRVVGEQLASAAGLRRPPAVDADTPDLGPLYEAAARARATRHRRLLLIVDGLDEDADADQKGCGIAGLLPKHPPHGMRVIVAGRHHPHAPLDLVSDHPLRSPSVVRQLTDSPAARIIRDSAMQELKALVKDPAVGRRLLGLLASAQGALSGQDLADLIGIPPLEVEERLRSVVGRSMAPTRVELLPLDAQLQAEVDAGLQTFVLAHTELQKAAVSALGRNTIAACKKQLHAWADGFRTEGWPEDTPNYLLTGYTQLVRESADTERLADLVLDPRRQLRLAERSGPDVALADLDFVAPSSSSPSLSTAARASASRELLVPHVRPLPGAISRTIARLGDVRRARNLALASGSAAAKADNLAGVAHVLAAIGNKQAAQTARDAAHWARTALTATGSRNFATDEAEAAAGQAALALLATEQQQDGLVLLRSTRGSSTARNEACAEAARMLPSHRAELLDGLEEQAETLAAEALEDDGTGAVALELWATVAAADGTRVNRLYDRVLEHAHAVWEAAPTLANVAVLATTASLLSQDRPQEATDLVSTACRHIASTVLGDVPLTAADAFRLEFDFRHTLAALARARDDIGAVGEEFDDVLARVEALLPRSRPSRTPPTTTTPRRASGWPTKPSGSRTRATTAKPSAAWSRRWPSCRPPERLRATRPYGCRVSPTRSSGPKPPETSRRCSNWRTAPLTGHEPTPRWLWPTRTPGRARRRGSTRGKQPVGRLSARPRTRTGHSRRRRWRPRATRKPRLLSSSSSGRPPTAADGPSGDRRTARPASPSLRNSAPATLSCPPTCCSRFSSNSTPASPRPAARAYWSASPNSYQPLHTSLAVRRS